ncbi:DUF3180 domain-containing protein [Paenarthrobacter sp. PH39-S1]|uniref:DUF3180 domain-containing protein n=1 Tax=Micrococcaceae TaxID=1268 RepID=UPI0024BBD126|nr:DUF3180 domain-containing protein [Paenarthrobacter sp. PH39-S1]MDJ0354998.1 DUF3180 domain-containing protein [Paenarthrobacter sp. PH39-S1]
MRTIRPVWLAVIALVSGAAGWVATVLANRASLPTPVLPLSSLLTMGIIVAMTVVLGLRVRSWRNGKRDRVLNPILAARTWVLAQACAYAGALLFGWHVGILLDQLPTIALRSNLTVIWLALAMVGGSVVMVAVGFIVERFCRLPPDDDVPPAERKKRDSAGEEEYA